jgi:uncharacterized protein (DUF3084 family)
MWRIRGFMLADILPQMQVIGHQFTEIKGELRATREQLEALRKELVAGRDSAGDALTKLPGGLDALTRAVEAQGSTAQQVQEVAAEINRVVLTLALSNMRVPTMAAGDTCDDFKLEPSAARDQEPRTTASHTPPGSAPG